MLLQPLFVESSHCRNSIISAKNSEYEEDLVGKTFPSGSRLRIEAQDVRIGIFSVVNCGSGTTGTHSIYDAMCDHKYKSVHFRLSCNYDSESDYVLQKRQALEMWHVMLTRCVLSSSRKNHCRSDTILKKLRSALLDALPVINFITDSPTDVIFPEIAAIYPETVRVICTYRNPHTWAKRRLRTHGTTQLICRPELWAHGAVLHPFDIVGCLLYNTTFPFDVLTTTFEFINGVDFDTFKTLSDSQRKAVALARGNSVQRLEKAYRLLNTVNYRIIQAKNLQFLPICLWDLPKNNNTALHVIIDHFLRSEISVNGRLLSTNIEYENALNLVYPSNSDAVQSVAGRNKLSVDFAILFCGIFMMTLFCYKSTSIMSMWSKVLLRR